MAITDHARLNCLRRDIGFEPNSCIAFVDFPDILRNVDDLKQVALDMYGGNMMGMLEEGC